MTETSDRREQILDAARDVFIHYGFRRATLDDIASAAGLSRTGVYHHFASKEELFRTVTERTQHEAVAAAERARLAEGPLDAVLVDVLDAVLGSFIEIIRTARHGRELVDETNRLCADVVAQTNEAHHAMVRDLLESAAQSGAIDLEANALDANLAARYLVSIAGAVASFAAGRDPRKTYREHLTRVVRVFLRGLARR